MKNLIKVEDLSYSIPFGKEILKDVSFELNEGEIIGILGRNGAGKTTLIDLLLGIRPTTKGSIKILGENPIKEDRIGSTSICFISQDVSLNSSLGVGKFLDFYAGFYPQYSRSEEKCLLELFTVNREDQIASLSTGQQKKVQIIAALAANPKILLIDEITAVLDPETRNQFFTQLSKEKTTKGLSIVLATNIAEDLTSRADKVLFIDNGVGRIEQPDQILNLFNLKKSA
ncbi:MAG: ABC transporter ATP-binding protein [Bacteriovorax sp.]|jgi:ABC-2 type transport system ATP-binding protein